MAPRVTPPTQGRQWRCRERGHWQRSPHTLLPQDHCFYQGNVEGHQGSAVSLSTCAGLRWVLPTRRGASGRQGPALSHSPAK